MRDVGFEAGVLSLNYVEALVVDTVGFRVIDRRVAAAGGCG